MSTTRIFVTGAPGWLGTRFVGCLINGLPEQPTLAGGITCDEIHVLAQPGASVDELKSLSSRIHVHFGDVRDAAKVTEWLEGARDALVFHLAGLIHPRRAREFDAVNFGGTKNVIAAAESAGARRLVHMSSNSPFGVNPHRDHRFDENSPFRPYMGYGRSKMRAEKEVAAAQRRGRLETVVIRAPWFYGPNQPARQALFFQMVRDGKAPIVGSGENMRSMTYIDNLCQGLMLAGLEPKANGHAYWIADKQAYSMNEIVDTIENVLETEYGYRCAHKRLRLPGLASKVAFAVDAGLQRLGLYHQKIHVLSEMNKDIACDVALAERELGYRPTVALREGMSKSIAWARANKQI